MKKYSKTLSDEGKCAQSRSNTDFWMRWENNKYKKLIFFKENSPLDELRAKYVDRAKKRRKLMGSEPAKGMNPAGGIYTGCIAAPVPGDFWNNFNNFFFHSFRLFYRFCTIEFNSPITTQGRNGAN